MTGSTIDRRRFMQAVASAAFLLIEKNAPVSVTVNRIKGRQRKAQASNW